jgi:PKD repeat protein
MVSGVRTDVPTEPTAAFTFAPEAPFAGSPVIFTDVSEDDGSITAWAWDFGDPSSGADNVSDTETGVHRFAAPGQYAVKLTGTDDEGLSDSTVQLITVTPP